MEDSEEGAFCQIDENTTQENRALVEDTPLVIENCDHDTGSYANEEHPLPVHFTQDIPTFRMTVEDVDRYYTVTGSIKGCITSRPCSVCLYLFLSLVILCSLVSLMVISFLVTAPYMRAAQFVKTQCTSVGMVYATGEERCSCGKGCSSHYPCIIITVNFTDTSNITHEAYLANDERALHKKCSFYPRCQSSESENRETVRQFARKFALSNDTLHCLHNPHKPNEVIRIRRYRLYHVLHGMLWTSFVFLLSFTLISLLYRIRGCELT